MLLLAAYSAGLAVPFLIAALALDSFLRWFQGFRRYLPWVMRVSGALLVVRGGPDGHGRVHPAGRLAPGLHARTALRERI